MSADLLKWVKARLAQGATRDQVAAELAKAGHPQAAITEALNAAAPAAPVTPATGTFAPVATPTAAAASGGLPIVPIAIGVIALLIVGGIVVVGGGLLLFSSSGGGDMFTSIPSTITTSDGGDRCGLIDTRIVDQEISDFNTCKAVCNQLGVDGVCYSEQNECICAYLPDSTDPTVSCGNIADLAMEPFAKNNTNEETANQCALKCKEDYDVGYSCYNATSKRCHCRELDCYCTPLPPDEPEPEFELEPEFEPELEHENELVYNSDVFEITYGGGASMNAVQTSDGGYALTGYVTIPGGSWDIILLKTDEYGNEQWRKTFNKGSRDYGLGLVQTSDGGYAISGVVRGEVTDILLIKTDSSGNKQWDKSIGTSGDDRAKLIQTTDGGFLLFGYSQLGIEAWIIKTDLAGNIQWESKPGKGFFESAVITNEGGYMLSGGLSDQGAVVMKLSSSGAEEWIKELSGSEADSLILTNDGYVIASTDDNSKSEDVYVTKTNFDGDQIWVTEFNNAKYENAIGIVRAADGGYVMLSVGDNTFWLNKVNSNGAEDWVSEIDLASERYADYSLSIALDGGYVICGQTSNDKVTLIKTNAEGEL